MKIKALGAFRTYRLMAIQDNYGKMDKREYRDLQAGKEVDVPNDTAEALIKGGLCMAVKIPDKAVNSVPGETSKGGGN